MGRGKRNVIEMREPNNAELRYSQLLIHATLFPRFILLPPPLHLSPQPSSLKPESSTLDLSLMPALSLSLPLVLCLSLVLWVLTA
jgi:hypothetical protein